MQLWFVILDPNFCYVKFELFSFIKQRRLDEKGHFWMKNWNKIILVKELIGVKLKNKWRLLTNSCTGYCVLNHKLLYDG